MQESGFMFFCEKLINKRIGDNYAPFPLIQPLTPPQLTHLHPSPSPLIPVPLMPALESFYVNTNICRYTTQYEDLKNIKRKSFITIAYFFIL